MQFHLRPTPHGVEQLRRELLSVLDDEEASFVPPSAKGMSRDRWHALPERTRQRYRRLQLQRTNPKLLSNLVRGPGRLRRKSPVH